MSRIAFLFGLIFFMGCEPESPNQKPENLLSEELYIDLFFELEMLKTYQDEGVAGQTIDSLYGVILKKYEIDSTQFLQSHQYYQTQIPEQLERVDSVIARIERELVPINRLDSLRNHLD